jgi:hypothetical protein
LIAPYLTLFPIYGKGSSRLFNLRGFFITDVTKYPVG